MYHLPRPNRSGGVFFYSLFKMFAKKKIVHSFVFVSWLVLLFTGVHGYVLAQQDEKCQQCHKVMYETFKTTVHNEYGCNSCHDESTVDSLKVVKTKCQLANMKNPQILNLSGQSEVCGTCHEQFSEYMQSGKVEFASCITCHDPHKVKSEKFLVRSEEKLCRICHSDVPGTHNLITPICIYLHRNVGDDEIICQNCHMLGKNHDMKFKKRACLVCHKENDEKWVMKTIRDKKDLLKRELIAEAGRSDKRYDFLGKDVYLGVSRHTLKTLSTFLPLLLFLSLFLVLYFIFSKWY